MCFPYPMEKVIALEYKMKTHLTVQMEVSAGVIFTQPGRSLLPEGNLLT